MLNINKKMFVDFIRFFYTGNNSDELIICDGMKTIKNISNKIKIIRLGKKLNGPKILLDDNFMVETIDLSRVIYYDGTLEHLPPKLINLYLNDSIHKRIENFPQNLKCLQCSDEFYFRQTNITNRLKKLIIKQSSIYPNDNFIFESINLPIELEELYFDYEDEYKPTIRYSDEFIKLVKNLPMNLKIFKLPSFYDHPLDNLPLCLEKLYIGKHYNHQLDNIPTSIKFIEFVEGMKFNKSLDNLPSQLEYLNLKFENNLFHTISNLPNSIKFLEIGKYELEISKLPKDLITLCIASPIKFNFVKSELKIVLNKNTKDMKNIKYFNMEFVGKYNMKNNIKIEIPQNLSCVTWSDCESSTYTYKKCMENGLW